MFLNVLLITSLVLCYKAPRSPSRPNTRFYTQGLQEERRITSSFPTDKYPLHLTDPRDHSRGGRDSEISGGAKLLGGAKEEATDWKLSCIGSPTEHTREQGGFERPLAFGSLYSLGMMGNYRRSQFLGIEETTGALMNLNIERVSGITRFFYEDFHVNEIGLDGKILKTDRFISRAEVIEAIRKQKEVESGLNFLLNYGGDYQFPEEILTKDDVRRLNLLITKLKESLRQAVEIPKCFVTCTTTLKETRTALHQYIRNKLMFLDSKTLTLAQLRDQGYRELEDFTELNDDTNLISITPKGLCLKTLNEERYKSQNAGVNEEGSSHLTPEEDVSNASATGDPTPNTSAGNTNPVEVVGRKDGSHSVDSVDTVLPASRSLSDLTKYVDCTDYSSFPKEHKKVLRMKRFLHFTVTKVNRDTSDVVNALCRCLNRAAFDMFTAGNKDRRAITTQRMCIRRGDIQDILSAMSRNDWPADVYLSDFKYSDARLHLGDLIGNYFKIAIRGIKKPSSVVKAIEHLKKCGFINYFGLQRFGTHLIGTHIIGSAIISKDYDKAIKLILGDSETANSVPIFHDMVNSNNGRYQDSSPKAAGGNISSETHSSPALVEEVPHGSKCEQYAGENNTIESSVTSGNFSEMTGDPVEWERDDVHMGRRYSIATDYYLRDGDIDSALRYLPRHLFIERSVLKGLQQGLEGMKCLDKIPKNILSIYVHATQSVIFNLVATYRLRKYGLRPIIGDLVLKHSRNEDLSFPRDSSFADGSTEKRLMDVIEITTESESSHYSIDDVVLPLPGDNVTYPSVLFDYYEKVAMEKFGLPLSTFSSSNRDLVSIAGSYRNIIVKPWDVEYQIFEKLDDPCKILIESITSKVNERLRKPEEELEYLSSSSSLVLKCSLPKSSYITIALRELLVDESLEYFKFN